MSGTARNYCVVRATQSAATTFVAYQVPAGFNLILKDARFTCGGSVANNIILYVTGPAGVPSIELARIALAPNTPGAWSGWLVVNDQDYVVLSCDQGGLGYWISGALLTASAIPV